jgi:hypothetical protein
MSDSKSLMVDFGKVMTRMRKVVAMRLKKRRSRM